MSIALVTDSTSDIPTEVLLHHDIHVIPNIVIIDGKNLVDGKDITRKTFYDNLPAMSTPPTTATASSGAYHELYESLLNQGASHILSIHAASQLSGIFNAASAAALEFENRVTVVDSGQLTLGLGFQVIAAAETSAQLKNLSESQKLTAMLNTIDDIQKRVHVIAMLDTLEYVRRSGRVSWARARIGNMLRIKPFLSVNDGRVLSLGEARTRRKGIARLKQFLVSLGETERLAILHTNAETDAHQILADLNLELEQEPFIINVTPVIGTHVGPNGLGIAAVVKSII